MPDTEGGSLGDLLLRFAITVAIDSSTLEYHLPAHAGTQWRSLQDAGFPLSRE
jgi:hypothetical protein